MRRPLALSVAAVVIALVGTACGSSVGSSLPTAKPDAATMSYTVKGSTKTFRVSRDSLLSEVAKIVADKPFGTLAKQNNFSINKDVSTDTTVSAIWLSNLIRQQAIDELFSSRHLHVTAAVQAQADKDVLTGVFPTADIYNALDATFRKTLADRYARLETVIASYSHTSDADGQKYFKAHESQFACPSGKDVAHILVATQAAAQSILDQIRAGASFATLAQKNSTDSSGAQGGSLGCLASGEFVPAFQTAADSAPLGTPIGPVHSQFGYHIILVTAAPPPSYESSKTQVQTALTQQGVTAGQGAIDGLLKAFKVHLDPRFGTWGLVQLGQGQSAYEVTAPKAPAPNTSREGSTTTTTAPVAIPGAAGTP